MERRSAAEAIEAGRALARDIGSGDPERMAPLRLAEAVRSALADEDVQVEILREESYLREQYPLGLEGCWLVNKVFPDKPAAWDV